MEIKIKKLLFISIIMFELNCSIKNDVNKNNINNEINIFEYIKISNSEIIQHLKSNDFTHNKFKSVLVMQYWPENKTNFCEILSQNLTYSDFINSLNSESIISTAYFSDDQNILKAQSTSYTLIKDCSFLTSYKVDQKIAIKALENRYSAFITFDCSEKIFIGLNENVLDIYQLEKDELALKSSIRKI